MKILIKYFFIWFTLTFLLTSCEKDNPIQGFDLANPGGRGQLKSITISKLEQETTFKGKVAPTGNSLSLSLGSFNNIETRILMKWENLRDTLKIESATIILKPRLTLGDSSGSFMAIAHKVLKDWAEDSVTVENFDILGDVDQNILGQTEVFAVNQDTSLIDSISLEIDPALVQAWIDSTEPNYGVFIDFSGADFIREFSSSENDKNRPILQLVGRVNDTKKDTSKFVATMDAFLISSQADPPEGPLYVSNAFRNQSVLKFDLSTIPQAANILKAQLVLKLQNSNSILTSDGMVIQILRLLEAFETPETVNADSSFVFTSTVRDTLTTVTVNLRSMVQDWTLGRKENHGLIIQPARPGRDISRVAFFSSQQDTSQAPKLLIDFTIPPEGP